MIVGSIARRYAKALFALAAERDRIEQWSEGLAALKAAIAASPELREVLANPVYEREQRRAIAEKLASALGLDEEPANLLFLLADRNRLAYLDAIVDTFRQLADEKLGRVRATVVSAVPLENAVLNHIADRLAQATKAEVIVDREIDPTILGGIVARVGSLTYDGSVRTQLEQLRRSLKQ